MKNYLLANKYPIRVLELKREETCYQTLDEVLQVLEKNIESDPQATMIAVFDHYAHTTAINGEISADIIAAKNIVFCFGIKLPDPAMLAVRPRSIGIAEQKDSYIISFLEAPMEMANTKMLEWVKALRNTAQRLSSSGHTSHQEISNL